MVSNEAGSLLTVSLWIATLVLALSVWLLAQTATAPQTFPLLFHGGAINQNGDIRWESLLYALNLNSAEGTATLRLLKGDGSPQAVSLESGPEQSVHTLTVPAGQTRVFRVTSSYPQIQVFWGRAEVMPGMRLTGDFRLYGTNGIVTEAFLSFARQVGPAAFAAREMTVSPVLLGPVDGFTQREVVFAAANSGPVPAQVTATLFDNGGTNRGSVPFTVPPGGQVVRFLFGDFQQTLEGGRVEVVSSQDIYVAALQFLNQYFSAIDIAAGIHHPNQPSRIAIEVPAEGQELDATAASTAVQVRGWAADQDGVLGSVNVSVDGGTPVTVPFTINRPDVQAAYPGAQLMSRWTTTVNAAANASHRITVSATDGAGMTTEKTVNFVVRLTAPLVIGDGRFVGTGDPNQMVPPGTSIEFTMDVKGNKITYLFLSNLKMNCNGSDKTFSAFLVGPGAGNPLTLVDGRYSISGLCGETSIRFLSQNDGTLFDTTLGSCWPAPSYSGCPTVEATVQLMRQ